MKNIEEDIYLDFKDVMIKPCISSVESRSDVDLKMHFEHMEAEYIKSWKPIPVMSSNMDTVTGIRMAYELAKHNMIPVLHKYVSLEQIKILFDKIDNFNQKIKFIDFNKPSKSDIKFLEEEGIVNHLDLNLIEDLNNEGIEEIIENHQKNIQQKLKELKSDNFAIDYRNIFISRGTTELDKEKLEERLEKEPRIQSVCIDVANGYRESVFKYVKDLREGFCKDKIMMVGNVATPDAYSKYSQIGIEIVKCGIGSGAACITRVQTGVGVPQLSMILKIKTFIEEERLHLINEIDHYEMKQFKGENTPISQKEYRNKIFKIRAPGQTMICADGGITIPGDIAKSFVAGADFVMLGGMFAGHQESPGKFENVDGKKMIRFSGMAAKESQWNGVPEYGTAEGKTVMIPYRGKVKNTIQNILGGVRSTCTYTNSKNITDLSKATFIRVNAQENRIFN